MPDATPTPHARITARLDALLRRGGIRAVDVAGEPGYPDKGDGDDAAVFTNVAEHPRLSVCLSGRRHYRVTQPGGGTVVVTHGAGGGLYVAPGCWLAVERRAAHTQLAVVFAPTFTRFVLTRFHPKTTRGLPLDVATEFHHAPAALDDAGRRFCNEVLIPPSGATPGEAALHRRRLFDLCLLRAAALLRARGSRDDDGGPARGKAWFTWQAATEFLHEHCQRPLGRKTVAQHLRLHPNHVSRLFAQFGGGETFAAALRRARLERARRLLADPRLNVAEVARLCQFRGANYLARCYRAHFGETPTRARAVVRARD